MKTIEELCKEAFIDATGVYKNVSVKDWWQEFKMQNNIEQKSNDVGDDSENKWIEKLEKMPDLNEQKSIDVGDVEKAAENFAKNPPKLLGLYSTLFNQYLFCFKAGAEWQKQSNTTDVGEHEDEVWQQLVDFINDYDRNAVFSLPLLEVKKQFSITRKQ